MFALTVHRSHHKGCLATIPSCIDVNAFVQQAFDLFQPATMASCYQLRFLSLASAKGGGPKDHQIAATYHHNTQNTRVLHSHDACLLVYLLVFVFLCVGVISR